MHRAWFVAILVACGGKAPPPPPPPKPAPVVEAPKPAPKPPTAREQLDWVIATVRKGTVDRAEVEAHFDAKFLAEVPADQVIAIVRELQKQLPELAIVDVKEQDNKLLAHLASGKIKLRAELAVEGGKIVGMIFQPEIEPAPKLASLDEAEQRLKQLAPHAQLLVASLDHDKCKPIRAVAATDELAIGSTFKLYILLALADQIIAGKRTWDEELAVRDDWKSLPSGITQNDAAGTKFPIRTFAERMISISDNTATDHMLYTVGRKNVEAALEEAKHSHPDRDIPFMSTREMFLLKLDVPSDDYVKLGPAQRRTYLDKELAGKAASLDKVATWKTAHSIDKLEWFANAGDLCNVMATLHARAQNAKAAPLLDVLAKNPGVPIDKTKFPYIGYKGGSEPGVMNLTFLLRRADDKWFVVVVGANADEGGAVDDDKLAWLASNVIELVAGL